MYVNWKVERYERTGDSTWSSTAIVETNFYDVNVRGSLGEGRDTFSFKQRNVDNELDGYWNIGDKIILSYKVNGSSFTSDDVVLNGLVTNLPDEISGTSNIIRVEGNNYSESLMTALVFVSPPATGWTIPEMVQQALNSVTNFNPNFKVTWSSTNPSTKDDGSAFPKVYEKWYYKSCLKLLERYSSDNYTEDGNYYWYVSADNELIWQKQLSSASDSFDTSIDPYKKLKISKDTKGVINFVIAKGGSDWAGKPVSTRYDDAVSRAKHGFKYKLIISEANTIHTLLGDDKIGGTWVGSNEKFPNDSNYPSTSGWVSQITGSTVSSSSFLDYNSNVRGELKYRLKAEARAFVNERKNGKLSTTVDFDNGKGWNIGNVIAVTIPKLGKTNDPIRVTDKILTQGVETYTLVEDEGTI